MVRSPPHELPDEAGAARHDATGLGRDADAPARIPWLGWKRVLRRTAIDMTSDRVALSAAGCAFWATLALFPGISMLISLYGLVFDPVTVEPQLQVLRGLLPGPAFVLINDRVHVLVSHGRGSLSLSLLVSTLVALWSATSGTKAVLSALNLAYDENERRGVIRFQVTALGMTLCAVLTAILAIALLVALPLVLDAVQNRLHGPLLAPALKLEALALRVVSLALLIGLVLLSLSLLYRFGPSRRLARWRWVTPGSAVATVLWLAASVLFSYYVGHVASYDATYGPLGAVIGVMMWFYVTAYAVLLGAELNAELELQTARDSSDGPPRPIGRRGAYVADHVAG